VIKVDPCADPRWDAFVEGARGASVYHLGAWARILRSAYGFRPRYMAIEGADGDFEGVLPMFQSRGPVTGRRLRSLPAVAPPSGPLARTRDGLAALVEAAAATLAESGAAQWVWLSRDEAMEELVPGLGLGTTQLTWIAELAGEPDEQRTRLRKHSNNLHRSIKKAEAAALTVREGSGEADLRAFYRLYLATMREHRSLPRPYRQMRADLRELGPRDATRVFLVDHGADTVAAGLFHVFGDTVELLYNGSDRDALQMRPNHALYWHVMRWAIERGYRRFDFGDAAEDSSLGRFKQQWTAEPVREYIYILRSDRRTAVGEAARRRNPNVGVGDSRVGRAWGRLPLPVTQVAGAVAYRL
jgi:predicted N-acyltransferase